MSNFDEGTIEKVWRKGRTIADWDKNEYRLDAAGALMIKSHRGTDDDYDWEIEHVFPRERLKEEFIPEEEWDNIDNLRPFNAKNNAKKSDDYPCYTRKLVFDKSRNRNVESEIGKVVNEEVQRTVNRCFNFNFDIVKGEPSEIE